MRKTGEINDLGSAINAFLNGQGEANTGYALFVFPFAEPGQNECHYISNANMKGVVDMLSAMLPKFQQILDKEVNDAKDPDRKDGEG